MSGRQRIVVAGAGVFGLASAVSLLDSGAEVLVVDPDIGGTNASAVAAGLLAPVGEAAFDAHAASHYAFLSDALSLWPSFADEAGIALSDHGLVIPAELAATAAALGVDATPHPWGVLCRADPRVVDPSAALAALRGRTLALGGRIETRSVSAQDWRDADLVVLATGCGGSVAGGPPELSRLSPVKGQIAVLPRGPGEGPTVRWKGGYLAPQPGGARVGATMELGRCDTKVEPDIIAGLIDAAVERVPGLDVEGAFGQAGVRMQTPDALPIVGASIRPKTLLAAGARRNGWLLAPMVGRMIAAYAAGRPAGRWADSLHPGRFERGAT